MIVSGANINAKKKQTIVDPAIIATKNKTQKEKQNKWNPAKRSVHCIYNAGGEVKKDKKKAENIYGK